jgi:hypothetical protein
VVFQTNPETEIKTVSRGPANLRDEYFRLLGIQSRRNLKRFEGPLGGTWSVVVQLVFVYLSCCITSKRITIERDPPLLAVTSRLTATTRTDKGR